MPQQYETENTQTIFAAETKLINRHPAEFGVGVPGIVDPHIELEVDYDGQSLHVPLAATEARELARRLDAHANVLEQP